MPGGGGEKNKWQHFLISQHLKSSNIVCFPPCFVISRKKRRSTLESHCGRLIPEQAVHPPPPPPPPAPNRRCSAKLCLHNCRETKTSFAPKQGVNVKLTAAQQVAIKFCQEGSTLCCAVLLLFPLFEVVFTLLHSIENQLFFFSKE